MVADFKRIKEFSLRKRLHCVSCARQTIHTLEAKCASSEETLYGYTVGAEYSIFRCGGCDTVCYETGTWDSSDYDIDDNGNAYVLTHTTQYPPPISASYNFNTEHVPPPFVEILDEMLYAMAGNKMRLATIGLRLCIEYITTDLKCTGSRLQHKIDNLHNSGHITIDQKDILHRIRKKANAGAHEAIAMTSNELLAGMGLVQLLIEKIYNAPAREQLISQLGLQTFKVPVPAPTSFATIPSEPLLTLEGAPASSEVSVVRTFGTDVGLN